MESFFKALKIERVAISSIGSKVSTIDSAFTRRSVTRHQSALNPDWRLHRMVYVKPRQGQTVQSDISDFGFEFCYRPIRKFFAKQVALSVKYVDPLSQQGIVIRQDRARGGSPAEAPRFRKEKDLTSKRKRG
jgi:hypothetical protein